MRKTQAASTPYREKAPLLSCVYNIAMAILHKHLVVSGKVQGVFYRAAMQEQAVQLKVDGWVRNLSDGKVEAQVVGDKQAVERLLNWMKEGPVFAEVDGIEEADLPVTEKLPIGFEILPNL